MIALAKFICRGRSQAVLVIGAFALFAITVLPLSPLFIISGAALALVTLQNKPEVSLFILGLAYGLCALVLLLAGVVKIGYFLLMVWVPIWITAEVLRRSGNLALALLALLIMVSLAVSVFLFVVPDSVAMWYRFFELIQETPELAPQFRLSRERIDIAVVLATGFVASSSLLTLTACLLLGRWWQDRLVNPGGFKREFNSLNLGKILSTAAVLLVIAASFFATQLLIALSAVFVIVFLFQGLAVIHAFTADQPKMRIWLIIFYVLLLFLNEMLVMVSLLGIADSWLNSRRRWLPKRM